MIGWTSASLGDCLERLIDYRGKSPPKSPAGIPVISAKVVKTGGLLKPIEQTIAPEHYSAWMRRGLPKVGDVVLTTEGPLGEVIQLDRESVTYALGQRVVCLRGRAGVLDNTFLRYLLTSPVQQKVLASYATGTTVAGISQKALRSVPISFPDYSEQVRIGEALSALDDKIELNRQMSETLEAMGQAVFRDWFVDFGPVRRKLAGATDPVQIMGGLVPDPTRALEISSLFPGATDDLGLPTGWTTSTLGEEATIVLGGTPSRQRPEYWSGDIPWINSGKANEFRVIEPSEFITQVGMDRSATKLLPRRTTLVAITGATLGQVSLAEIETCANQSIVGVSECGKLPSEFLYLWVKENIEALVALQTGGAQQHINKGNVEQLAVTRPATSVLHEWNRIAVPVFDRIASACFESRALADARDYLLPRLMSGEARVGGVAEEIAA